MLVGGTVLAVMKGSQILDMGLQVLGAWSSYVPILAEPNPRPIPAYDFFWPTFALLGGFATFAVGWVVIIRGTEIAWPARFDRSQQSAS